MNDRYPIESEQRVYGLISSLNTLYVQGLLSLQSYELMRDILIDSHFHNLQSYENKLKGHKQHEYRTHL